MPWLAQQLHPPPGNPNILRFEVYAQVSPPVASGCNGDGADTTERVQHQSARTGEGANQFLALVEGFRAWMELGQVIEGGIADEPVPRPEEIRRTIDGPALVEENDRLPATGYRLTALERGNLADRRIDHEVLVAKPVPEVAPVAATLEAGAHPPG